VNRAHEAKTKKPTTKKKWGKWRKGKVKKVRGNTSMVPLKKEPSGSALAKNQVFARRLGLKSQEGELRGDLKKRGGGVSTNKL